MLRWRERPRTALVCWLAGVLGVAFFGLAYSRTNGSGQTWGEVPTGPGLGRTWRRGVGLPAAVELLAAWTWTWTWTWT